MRTSISTSTPTTVIVSWPEARLLVATIIISLSATFYVCLHVMMALWNLNDISMVINLLFFLEFSGNYCVTELTEDYF